AVCRKYGILLICDEVICGFGRLGEWFGHQHYGIKPDLIAMAKGLSSGYLPISAVGVSKTIVDVLLEKGGDFVHGYTYSGHPTCAAVALANIEIMENEDLITRTRDVTGPYLTQALKRLDGHPLVGEARSLGLIGAVEIVAEKGTNTRFTGKEGTAGPMVRDLCIKNGLMVRGIRDSIVMCPPLIVTEAEIDRIVDIIERSLDEAGPALRAL
ncbi:MAG: aminotransferase class III-fold pyridoxal phosphate-dependent enzyme, partial [Asticcacaulis sp.]|nr:aminotransferase class III-fold pyridoxal phosphate-dependent enzyme [Asticcacaulis sp.]